MDANLIDRSHLERPLIILLSLFLKQIFRSFHSDVKLLFQMKMIVKDKQPCRIIVRQNCAENTTVRILHIAEKLSRSDSHPGNWNAM